nr:unnamed protein product [Digitaria exilis]
MVGQLLVMASIDAGHPTAVLVRPGTTSDAGKAKIMETFKSCGARLVYGDINDHKGLVAAIKQAEVVISALGHSSPEEATRATASDRAEGGKRLLRALAGLDPDGAAWPRAASERAEAHDAGSTDGAVRSQTSASSGCKGSSVLFNFVLLHSNDVRESAAEFVPSEYGCDVELAEHMLEPAKSILGAKVRVREAVRAAGIPHTIISSNWLQRFLLPRAGNPEANGPPNNSVTIFGDGKPQVSPFPLNFQLAVLHATLVAGEAKLTAMAAATVASTGVGVEAIELYPDMSYVTVEDYLDGLQ